MIPYHRLRPSISVLYITILLGEANGIVHILGYSDRFWYLSMILFGFGTADAQVLAGKGRKAPWRRRRRIHTLGFVCASLLVTSLIGNA